MVLVICYVNSVFINSIIGMQVSNLTEREARQFVGALGDPNSE